MDELSLENKPAPEQRDEFNPDEVGIEGQGYIWRPEADSDDEMEQAQDVWGVDRISSSEDEVSSVSSEEEAPPGSPPPEDSRLFYNEVLESIRLGVADHVDPENIILEINASKFAYNVTFHELNHAVVKSLLESSLHDASLPNKTCPGILKSHVGCSAVSNLSSSFVRQRNPRGASDSASGILASPQEERTAALNHSVNSYDNRFLALSRGYKKRRKKVMMVTTKMMNKSNQFYQSCSKRCNK
ncbi:Translation initiation factor eIF-2B subunit epsilon [Desmophyllum pertusum]|uniref:Translation initiation factor eIF-2B subunit epsilon n=1 Tax=Desmophyllum pertusum TaxID=174260 RepID=A0A9X0CGE6_9CNID|nr:Translation initiation factor eIF-2B subunit epsilon [Desmophyllum pertusum]